MNKERQLELLEVADALLELKQWDYPETGYIHDLFAMIRNWLEKSEKGFE